MFPHTFKNFESQTSERYAIVLFIVTILVLKLYKCLPEHIFFDAQ